MRLVCLSVYLHQHLLIQNHKLCVESGDPVNKERYKRLVGHLIYLYHTRSDISYTISIVSRYMHDPKSGHLDVVYRILRYLILEKRVLEKGWCSWPSKMCGRSL
jgi:hypothetical protein